MKVGAHHRPVRRTIALVLAGSRGSRLQDLTENCAKPAVHFGGKFRIIDFVLSNCVNSGVHRIGVLTQYKSHSLLRHLQHGWSFLWRIRSASIAVRAAWCWSPVACWLHFGRQLVAI